MWKFWDANPPYHIFLCFISNFVLLHFKEKWSPWNQCLHFSYNFHKYMSLFIKMFRAQQWCKTSCWFSESYGISSGAFRRVWPLNGHMKNMSKPGWLGKWRSYATVLYLAHDEPFWVLIVILPTKSPIPSFNRGIGKNCFTIRKKNSHIVMWHTKMK